DQNVTDRTGNQRWRRGDARRLQQRQQLEAELPAPEREQLGQQDIGPQPAKQAEKRVAAALAPRIVDRRVVGGAQNLEIDVDRLCRRELLEGGAAEVEPGYRQPA